MIFWRRLQVSKGGSLRRMRPSIRATLPLALLALLPSCGHRKPPLAPAATTRRIEVVDRDPLDKQTDVPRNAEPWIEFNVPLDPKTIGITTVFLKIDTERLAIHVTYDAGRNRIDILPLALFTPGQAYTIELSPKIRTLDGRALPAPTTPWQFVAGSRIVANHPEPPLHAQDASRFTVFGWRRPPGGGDLLFSVYAGTDSAAVSGRIGTLEVTRADTFWVPRQSWPSGTNVYWSVDTYDFSTGKLSRGNTWSFRTLDPAQWRLDSVTVAPEEWGWSSVSDPTSAACGDSVLRAGGVISWLRFARPVVADPVRLEGVRVGMREDSTASDPGALVRLAPPLVQPDPCDLLATPNNTDVVYGWLAAELPDLSYRLSFHSDTLTAYVEAGLRGYAREGFLVGPTGFIVLEVLNRDPEENPRMKVWFWRK